MMADKMRADTSEILMQQAFENLDKNRDGYIDRDDVSTSLNQFTL